MTCFAFNVKYVTNVSSYKFCKYNDRREIAVKFTIYMFEIIIYLNGFSYISCEIAYLELTKVTSTRRAARHTYAHATTFFKWMEAALLFLSCRFLRIPLQGPVATSDRASSSLLNGRIRGKTRCTERLREKERTVGKNCIKFSYSG